MVISHFVTALIKKIYDANINGDDKITLFGDGTPIRQFLHVSDFCNIIKYVIDNDIFDSFNVATTETLTIKEISEIAILSCGKELKIEWDSTKPNGQHRKDVSIERMLSIIKNYQPIKLIDGIKKVYNEYDKVSI